MTQTLEVPKSALIKSIDPEKTYYPDYWIDNDGNKIFTKKPHLGKDLTEGQILSLFEVNVRLYKFLKQL